jgi:hypothetical protein
MSYSDFFLNSAANVKQLDLLEISHPNFTQTYRIVRNAANGVTVTLEDSSVHFFQYYPLQIKGIAANQTLDQVLQVQLGDLGTVLPRELDAVAAAGTFGTKPIVKYRTYRSDDLNAPMYGPIILEIINMPFNSEGASFEASAPSVNMNKTGEIYTLDRFPMLRGFLS